MTDRSNAGGALQFRPLLLALVAFTLVGLFAELLLLEHFEDTLQWVPLIAIVMALIACLVVWKSPTRGSITGFRWLMVGFLIVGAVGVLLHVWGNYQFEMEMDDALNGVALWREVIMGATPALAPGAIAQVGLLGLLYTFRHPLLADSP